MVSNSEKAKFSNEYANAERSLVRNYFERVETRRHPSKSSNRYDEGIVQGVVKATQTGILWSQVQVLVGPPEKQTLIRNGGGFVIWVLLKVMVKFHLDR